MSSSFCVATCQVPERLRLVWRKRCDYEPFGEVQPDATCFVPTNYRFAGMEWDSETSLYHTWFRQYDVNQGRWMGADPLPGSPDNPR